MSLPIEVCSDCGKRYCRRPEKAMLITTHKERPCGVCGASGVSVSPEYDYGWLRDGWEAEKEAASNSTSNAVQGGPDGA